MKKIKTIHRRTFLRGLYSTAISLPILDIMLCSHGEAFAQGVALPKFYYSVYAGLASTGGSSGKSVLRPSAEGAIANLPLALSSLTTQGLANDVQILSNLTVPYGRGKAESLGKFHETGHLAYLSGLNNETVWNNKKPRFNSPDVLIAKHLKASNPLTLSVQASGYGSNHFGISFNTNGELKPQLNLQKTYNDLTGSVKSDDNTEELKRLFELKKRGTVLDLVKEDITKLKGSLGSNDKQKLERHITMFRELESKLTNLPDAPADVNYCTKAKDPGPDKPIGRRVDIDEWRKNGKQLDGDQAYSGEKERAQVAIDLAYMAMTCGLSPVTNLYVTWNHPWLNSRPITGINTDFHNLTHGGGKVDGDGDVGISRAHKWHVDIYSELTKKIKNTQIGGKSMLDQSVGLYFTEGGVGRDYYTGKNDGNRYPHSHNNATMVVAGRLGGLKPGKHFNTGETHQTKVFTSIMRSFGIDTNKTGDVTGIIDKLFS